MSYNVNGPVNHSLAMMRAKSYSDDMSSRSKNFRDAVEAMQQMAMDLTTLLGGIAQILLRVLGVVSG